jgi:hypothetical protein
MTTTKMNKYYISATLENEYGTAYGLAFYPIEGIAEELFEVLKKHEIHISGYEPVRVRPYYRDTRVELYEVSDIAQMVSDNVWNQVHVFRSNDCLIQELEHALKTIESDKKYA